MKKERRWLKSVLAVAVAQQVSLPWQRGARSKPDAMKSLTTSAIKPRALAAH